MIKDRATWPEIGLLAACGILMLVGMLGVARRLDWGTRQETGRLWSVLDVANNVISLLVGVGTFLYAWHWAYSHWGWLLGIGLGWVPSAIVAVMAAYLWWIAPAIVFVLIAIERLR